MIDLTILVIVVFAFGLVLRRQDRRLRRWCVKASGRYSGGSNAACKTILTSNSQEITDYKEFPGRSHYIVGQEGLEEVADFALEWAKEHAKRPAAS